MEDNFGNIFAQICELTANTDFLEAQAQFMEENHQTFEVGVEENKLEHTTIHEKYIYICEKYIDLTLKERFSELELSGFYNHFRDNYQMYE